MPSAADAFADFVPKSPFRENYSNLIKSIWLKPELQQQIEAKPSLLTQFGFTEVPKKVKIVLAVGLPTPNGYELQMNEYQTDKDGTVLFYVPPKPTIDDSIITAASSCCCSCCPCCCCT